TEVYVNGAFFWGGVSGGSAFTIPVAKPLSDGAQLAARQLACGRQSPLIPSGTVHNDVDNVALGWVSTDWLGQITGDRNLAGNPIINNTLIVDATGTDLGISVDHPFAGEDRTWFFFGDTGCDHGPDNPDSDHGSSAGDAIAWTTDASPT